MIFKNPASDLAAVVTGQTLGGVALVSGQNLFFEQIHPMPFSTSVFFLNSGGLPPEPYLSPTASAYLRPTVQVLVYATPGEDGFAEGEALTRGLAGYLQQLTVSGYVSVVFNESQASYLGMDGDTQRHMWSWNCRAEYVA